MGHPGRLGITRGKNQDSKKWEEGVELITEIRRSWAVKPWSDKLGG